MELSPAPRDPAGTPPVEALFRTLREVLKHRRWTYRDLAERLGMSESGVKKMFSARRCTVERLMALAEALEVPLSELARLAEEPAIRRVELTAAQQAWLLSHLDSFAFYWKLSVEKWPVSRIQKTYGLDDVSVRRMVGGLDDVGLLVLEPGDRIRLTQPDLVQWLDRGPLLDFLNRSWSRALLDEALRDPGARGVVFRLSFLALRPETARELADRLERLADEMVRRARYEQSTTPEAGLLARRLLLASAPGSFVERLGVGEGAGPTGGEDPAASGL